MDQLDITVKEMDTYYQLSVKGSINSYTFSDFQNSVYSLIQKTNLCLDMGEVKNISSAGLGVLMTALEDAESNGRKLYILRPSEIVRLAIDSTGFSEKFTIIGSVHEIA
jgi:anti-sigma B factor antagonist